MSTHIKEIQGRVETIDESGFVARLKYIPATISVTRFAGGDKGAMVQLTIETEEGASYIQLTKEKALELAETLGDAFDYDKYPSE